MRLIDAVTAASAVSEKHGIPLADLVDTFADIPTVDAVPVVRCRDCKHYCDGECFLCPHISSGVMKNDYCGYGARRDDDG